MVVVIMMIITMMMMMMMIQHDPLLVFNFDIYLTVHHWYK